MVAATVALTASAAPGAALDAAWPTYHLDGRRSGNDTAGPSLNPASPAWTVGPLDGGIYAEPVVAGGRVVVANDSHLHGPLGLALAPNGHLLVTNGDAVNADDQNPSTLVEFTTVFAVTRFAFESPEPSIKVHVEPSTLQTCSHERMSLRARSSGSRSNRFSPFISTSPAVTL